MAEQQHCNKQAQCLGGQHCSNRETKQQAWAQDEIEDGDATHVLARKPPPPFIIMRVIIFRCVIIGGA